MNSLEKQFKKQIEKKLKHMRVPCPTCKKPMRIVGTKATCMWCHDSGDIKVDASKPLKALKEIDKTIKKINKTLGS